jgi:GTP cyclohydrolase III
MRPYKVIKFEESAGKKIVSVVDDYDSVYFLLEGDEIVGFSGSEDRDSSGLHHIQGISDDILVKMGIMNTEEKRAKDQLMLEARRAENLKKQKAEYERLKAIFEAGKP